MKKIFKLSVILGFILAGSVSIISSCTPENKPETPIIKPTPEPEPEPGPNPNPNPDPEPVETLVYYDNLDLSSTSSTWFDQATSCYNPQGSGINSLSYKSAYAKITNSFPSEKYPEASGVNGVLFNKVEAFIQVRNIELPSDSRVFKISIGLYNPESGNPVVAGRTFKISILDENSISNDFTDLDFKVEKFGKWAYATAIFEIVSSETAKLSIQITSNVNQGRSDDLKLVSTTASTDHKVSFDYAEPEPNYDFIERPKALVSNQNYKYVDHSAFTYESKKQVRNYEACYDIKRHNPIWVAFPCHEIYDEGHKIRPSKDPWRPDPAFEDGEQSIIYGSDWNDWPNNSSRYWSGTKDGTFTTRGHLLGSADRGAGNKNVLFDLNVQTFYPTNVAPELYLNDTGGGEYYDSHWGMVERIRQDKWVCSDTLYVVIGCVYEQENWILYDDVIGSKYGANSKECLMPSARYLIALRTKSGTSGNPVWKCSADELMAIGFWFPQRFNKTTVSELPPLEDYIYTISEIEKKTGGEFSFFPLVNEKVKESFNIDDWPGLKEICK